MTKMKVRHAGGDEGDVGQKDDHAGVEDDEVESCVIVFIIFCIVVYKGKLSF